MLSYVAGWHDLPDRTGDPSYPGAAAFVRKADDLFGTTPEADCETSEPDPSLADGDAALPEMPAGPRHAKAVIADPGNAREGPFAAERSEPSRLPHCPMQSQGSPAQLGDRRRRSADRVHDHFLRVHAVCAFSGARQKHFRMSVKSQDDSMAR